MKYTISELKKIQYEISERVYIPSNRKELNDFHFIVGIDLAFIGNLGIACFAIFNTQNLSFFYMHETSPIEFPYIPSFLAFRELPLINKIYKKIRIDVDKTLFFIDGHGLSHPRKAGIATHFGVQNNTTSIGIAKKLLFGNYQNPQFIKDSETHYCKVLDHQMNPISIALKTSYLNRNSIMGTKILYISVGNNINLENSFELFLQVYKRYKFIPTELAHNHLQKIKKELKK